MQSKGQLGLPMIPADLDTPAFREVWDNWLADRAERRLPRYTARAMEMQLKRLAGWGVDAAIEAINWSIAQGYKGIFQPPTATTSTRPAMREPRWVLEKRLIADRTRLRDLLYPGGCAFAVELSGPAAAEAARIKARITSIKSTLDTYEG